MIFRHKYFSLDSDSKYVVDENNKKLRLTGNAYRVLVFLCQKKSTTITEIGDSLDWAKDYNEDNIRQYRYKINTVIGHDVVKYENKRYLIDGEIKEFDRNTDLLHQDQVKSKADSNKAMPKDKKFNIIPAIIAIVALGLTFIDWSSYTYYTIMKFVVTGVMIYYAWYIYDLIKKTDFWFWTLVAIAILFNPLVPVYLKDKGVWMMIDLVVAVFLVVACTRYKKQDL